MARALLFYVLTFLWATPIVFSMFCISPLVMLFDKIRRRPQHAFNTLWAKLSSFPFYGVEIVGRENLPPSNQPVVFVANHQSFLDITTLFHLNRDFKYISKWEVFMVPVIGWSMFLTGHIPLKRLDRRSQLQCLKVCCDYLARGTSVLFFPEGTRSKDGKMHAFKKGAFSVASKQQVPVVPITMDGTGDLMPNTMEYMLFPGAVKMHIHPAIPPGTAEEMSAAAEAAVASSLPPSRIGRDVLLQQPPPVPVLKL